MHDSNGRKIEFGDVVLHPKGTWYSDGKPRLLTVLGGSSQSDTCNLYCTDAQGSPKSAQITLNAKDTRVVLTRDGELVGL